MKGNKKLVKKIVSIILLVTYLCIFSMFSSEQETLIMINCLLIFACYCFIYVQINKTSKCETVYCDGRFWFFTIFLLYTIIVPFYGLLIHVSENEIRPLGTISIARTYTAEELLITTQISLLFFCGMAVGFFARKHFHILRSGDIYKKIESASKDDNIRDNRKAFIGWSTIAMISTLLFLTPFIRGGFEVLQTGGTILDVTSIEFSIQNSFIALFFSAEVMTIATIAMFYYWSRIAVSQRSRTIFLLAMVAFQFLIAYLTTRRARALIIIFGILLIFIESYYKRERKLPRLQMVIVLCVGIMFYFLEIISEKIPSETSIIAALKLFDGFGPYDALLLSAREAEPAGMISNVVYGLLRHIPILGKYIISFLGMHTNYPPLYIWMSQRYSIYAMGGGLAYMPQLEAYLAGGWLACAPFGVAYGFIFALPRRGIQNYIIVALAFMLSRGSLQVLLQLMWPYFFVSYLLYDQFLLKMRWRGKAGRRATEWQKDSLEI